TSTPEVEQPRRQRPVVAEERQRLSDNPDGELAVPGMGPPTEELGPAHGADPDGLPSGQPGPETPVLRRSPRQATDQEVRVEVDHPGRGPRRVDHARRSWRVARAQARAFAGVRRREFWS